MTNPTEPNGAALSAKPEMRPAVDSDWPPLPGSVLSWSEARWEVVGFVRDLMVLKVLSPTPHAPEYVVRSTEWWPRFVGQPGRMWPPDGMISMPSKEGLKRAELHVQIEGIWGDDAPAYQSFLDALILNTRTVDQQWTVTMLGQISGMPLCDVHGYAMWFSSAAMPLLTMCFTFIDEVTDEEFHLTSEEGASAIRDNRFVNPETGREATGDQLLGSLFPYYQPSDMLARLADEPVECRVCAYRGKLSADQIGCPCTGNK